MPIIKNLKAKEILDSRGNPTVSVICELESGASGEASVPSGVSTGEGEAYELRDNDGTRYNGKGVLKAVENVNTQISESLIGQELNQKTSDQALIDLDGTKNKKRLGANAILAVSLAFARACAREKKIQLYEHIANLYFKNGEARMYDLPQPSFNTIEGGRHSESGLSFQEFMLLPTEFKTMKEKVVVEQKVMKALQDILLKDGEEVTMGDEGGLAPKLSSNENALEYLERAIVSAGYDTNQIKIGLDVAATSFFENGQYFFENKIVSREKMISVYEDLCSRHNIISIEDGLEEKDFEGFSQITQRLGGKINVVGDDLTVTNVGLIKKAIQEKCINAVVIKPNQIGTLSETLEAIKLAKANNIKIFVSHRGGETEDTFIADLAVAVGADFIKAGGPTKKERICKYERLIEIEQVLTIKI